MSAPADDLFDAGPAGHLSPEGWRDLTPPQRAERLLFDAQQRVMQAASALNAGMVGSHEERTAALFFIADALRQQAKVMHRVRGVLSLALRRAEDPPAAVQGAAGRSTPKVRGTRARRAGPA